MKRSTSPKMLAYVRPWVWLTNRFSPDDKVVNASTSERPSGRNLCAVSKRRARITSFSISHRTRLDVSIVRSYRLLVAILSIAFMFHLLFRSRQEEPVG